MRQLPQMHSPVKMYCNFIIINIVVVSDGGGGGGASAMSAIAGLSPGPGVTGLAGAGGLGRQQPQQSGLQQQRSPPSAFLLQVKSTTKMRYSRVEKCLCCPAG